MSILKRILPTLVAGLALLLSSAGATAWELRSSIIGGGSVKALGEPLQIGMEVIGGAEEPAVDLYYAMLPPGHPLYFFNAETLFAAGVGLNPAISPYVTQLGPQNSRGMVLDIPALPAELPLGEYGFYALLVTAGGNLLDFADWRSALVSFPLTLTPPSQGVAKLGELPIPPQLTGSLNQAGQRVYDLTLQRGQMEFIAGTTTPTFGINGDYLGPTIRARRDDNVMLRVNNQLGEASTIHWHGLHVPAIMDGGPHQVVADGTVWEPHFTIDQPGGTFWYHPHLHMKTAEQVYKGLGGLFIIDDADTESAPLPKTYGVDDIPLVVQDRTIADDGSMNYVISTQNQVMQGMKGNKILVNGAITPTWHSAPQLVRLRLLNGSNARVYNFGFDDDRGFHQIATDSGLLEQPVPVTRVRLSPGERAEVLVDLRGDQGRALVLKSYSAEIAHQIASVPQLKDALDNSTFDVLHIVVDGSGDNGLQVPESLTVIERLDPATAVQTRQFAMSMPGPGQLLINNLAFDMNRIDQVVTLNTTEIWEISNAGPMAHPFHIHDVHFLILDRNGVPPTAVEDGWKDTVWVQANEIVRVIARFEDYADPDHPYMYHCHILEHEDAGMMGHFVVVEAGTDPGMTH